MKLTHPVIWPVEQRRRGYSKSNPRHEGTDYGWRTPHPTESRRILAAAPGRVTRVIDGGGWNQGWGNLVEIQHTSEAKTTYNHLRTGGIHVKVGATVKAGQHIATMGTTGDSTGDHLHWELWLLKSGTWSRVNPEAYLTKNLPGTPIIQPDRKPNERDVATPNGARVRTGPGLHFDTAGIALHGWRKPFARFVRGEEVNGSDVWLIYPDGGFTHLSGWLPQNTEALVDVTPEPEPVEPEPTPEPEPEPEPDPEVPTEPEKPVEPENPIEENPVTPKEPTVHLDPSKFATAIAALTGFLRGVLPDETRKRIYRIGKLILGPLTALAGMAAVVGPAIGGDLGQQIVIIGGTVSVAGGLVLTGLANLAGENITPKVDA